jgi:hypothetical protein
MPVKARAGGQGRVRTGRVGGQTGSGSSPGSPTGDPPAWAAPIWSQTDVSQFITISGSNNEIATRNSAFGGAWVSVRSETYQTSGLRYVELTVGQSSGGMFIGVGNAAEILNSAIGNPNSTAYWSIGQIVHSNAFVTVSPAPASFVAGDVIGMNVDLDANTIAFNKNGGTFTGTASLADLRPSSDPIFIMISLNETVGDTVRLNNV